MWNEERGFGFVSPDNGGEDVFVHRSALNEGVLLSPGQKVAYDGQWDPNKKKYRAAKVSYTTVGSSAEGASPQSSIRHATYHIVGSFGDWQIDAQPMTQNGGEVRHRITIRAEAPEGSAKRSLREEFQILGEREWSKRFYPPGQDKEEVVVLRPGAPALRMASHSQKGHGRNWAVEGQAGASFDIVVDTEKQTLFCEVVSLQK
jgi:CspA family cold shock protein